MIEYVDLGLKILDTLPLEIVEFIIVVTEFLTIEEADIGIKRPYTLHFEIVEKFLILMVEEDICLRPDTITTITQVAMVDCWVYNSHLVLLTIIFTLMIEVYKKTDKPLSFP